MRYLLVIGLLFSGLFAHSIGESHMHFFSTLHIDGLVVFLSVMILGFNLFKYFSKETN